MAFTSEIYLYLYDSILDRNRLFILINTGASENTNYIVFSKTSEKPLNMIIDINFMIENKITGEFPVDKTTYTLLKTDISLDQYFTEDQRQILENEQYILNIRVYINRMDSVNPDSFTIKNILWFSNANQETISNKIKTQINKLMRIIKLKILYKIINKYKKDVGIHLNAFAILENINTYIGSGDNKQIKPLLTQVLNGTLDLSEINQNEKDLIKCIMTYGGKVDGKEIDNIEEHKACSKTIVTVYKTYKELRF